MLSGDTVMAHTAMSLARMTGWIGRTVEVDFALLNPQFTIVPGGRCDAVMNAFKVLADFILFIDSDMTFPADTLPRLLSWDKDIVGCDASRTTHPFTPVIWKCIKGNKLKYKKGVLKLVPYLGCAVTLIKMDVFKKLKQPYFQTPPNPDGLTFMGEDVYFSRQAREAGFELYCDLGLSSEVGHLGVKEFKLPR
jgi:hypothetical protein